MHIQVGEGKREGDRIQSRLTSMEPDVGLELTNLEIRT